MKQCIPHVFRDADNFPLVSFCYERFADRVFARPMATRQGFVDDDDRLLVADFLFSERAAIQQLDAERGKVIWRNVVACDRIARGSNHHTRAAIHSRNGRAAIIRPIYGLATLKIAVFAPMPSASVRIAISAKTLRLSSIRTPNLMS